MRAYLVLLILLVTGCKTANPDFCCTTEQQCTELGSSELRPCKAGQACDTGTCVAKECDTSADCTDASQPVCINQLCEAKCTGDPDCTGSPGGPHCASDGVCVGCADASQCSTDKPFCDDQTRSCRGCIADSECSSGVCVEVEGRCAADAEIIYVAQGGSDTGTCTKTAPCASLPFAHTQARVDRNVIHVSGSVLNLSGTIDVTFPIIIDGSNTLFAGGVGSQLKVTAPATTTIEGVKIDAKTTLTVTNSSLRAFDTSFEMNSVTAMGSTLDISRCTFLQGGVVATGGGGVTLTTSTFQTNASVQTTNVDLSFARNLVDGIADNNGLRTQGGRVVIENNVFIALTEFTDMLSASTAMQGSSVRFNTFVNKSPIQMSPVAIGCDSTVNVTSNIIAYNSSDPIEGVGCVAKSSLFDTVGASDAAMGGSISRDPATFFKNRATGDFHLGPQSPAIGLGEAGLVTVDLDGHLRPASKPDAGAFEAP